MPAVTPCPLSATSFYEPFCSHAVGAVTGIMSTCNQGNCQMWGVTKAIDGVEAGINSLAVTGADDSPFMQIDLGTSPSALNAVRIAASSDATYSYTLASGANVWVSNNTNYLSGGVMCGNIGTFTMPGETRFVMCPVAAYRFITVVKPAISYLGRRLHQMPTLTTPTLTTPTLTETTVTSTGGGVPAGAQNDGGVGLPPAPTQTLAVQEISAVMAGGLPHVRPHTPPPHAVHSVWRCSV